MEIIVSFEPSEIANIMSSALINNLCTKSWLRGIELVMHSGEKNKKYENSDKPWYSIPSIYLETFQFNVLVTNESYESDPLNRGMYVRKLDNIDIVNGLDLMLKHDATDFGILRNGDFGLEVSSLFLQYVVFGEKRFPC